MAKKFKIVGNKCIEIGDNIYKVFSDLKAKFSKSKEYIDEITKNTREYGGNFLLSFQYLNIISQFFKHLNSLNGKD